MTELAVPERAAVATQPSPAEYRQPESSLEKWAREAAIISGVADAIANTSFAGQLRGKRDEVIAVILAGHELDLKPMASLKAFDIIQGTPALRAHAMRGLVMSKGHEVQLVESTRERCVYRGRRQGGGDDAWQTVTWTLERVGELGLLGKNEWKKQPQTMLIARATGEICRLIASDVLHGVPYSSEELQDSTVIRGEAAVARPRLSVAAITAPPELAPAPAVVETTHDEDDEDIWAKRHQEEFGAEWPEPAQPGTGIPQ